MPKVSVHAALRGPTAGEAVVEADGETVGACLDAVEAAHPGFKAQVVGPDGRPHKFIKLFVNGEPVDGAEAPVGPSDEVEILAAIGGG